jgi:hypothetical protein
MADSDPPNEAAAPPVARNAAGEVTMNPPQERKKRVFWRFTAAYLSFMGGISFVNALLTAMELRIDGARIGDPRFAVALASIILWGPAFAAGVALFRKKLWARTFATVWLCLPLLGCIAVSLFAPRGENVEALKRELLLLGAGHLLLIVPLFVNGPEPWVPTRPLDPP